MSCRIVGSVSACVGLMHLTCKNVTLCAVDYTHHAVTVAGYCLHNTFRLGDWVIDMSLVINRVIVVVIKTAVFIEFGITLNVAGDIVHPLRVTADIVLESQY